MLVRLKPAFPLVLAVLILVPPISTASPSLYFDDFPVAIANYVTGGWHGPFGDGTGGTITPTGDQMGVFLDGTVNALAYAIRRSPDVTDVNLTVDFALLNRDMTPADQFSLLLAWRNSTYPGQASCPPCSGPTPQSGIVVNFNIGRGSVRVTEVTNSVGTEVAVANSTISAGAEHEARAEYARGNLSVFLDSVRELVVTNLEKPSGVVGFMTYRVDANVDSLRFELPQSTPGGSGNAPGVSPSVWIVALVAGVAGGAVVFLATTIPAWTKRRRPGN